MHRRTFMTLLASTATQLAQPAIAQHRAGKRTIGLLHSTSQSYFELFAPSVKKGLSEAGWSEGQDVAIDYRWGEGKVNRLPGLAKDLVHQQVDVIFTVGGSAPAKAAKEATSIIPIVFISAADPIKAGLVASLNRPGGNVTGVSLIGSALEAKRLSMLRQLVPNASAIGALINPNYPDAERERHELQDAAQALKIHIEIVNARTEGEIEAAFAALAKQGVGAIQPAQDIFFNSRRELIVALADRYRLPAIYNQREYCEIGGLVSYGTHFADGYRQAGAYVGRVLKGEKPADLPVLQPTRFELVINLKAARALGLTIPPSLLATADEVIE